MNKPIRATFLCGLAAAAMAGPAWAGPVEVSFIDADRYFDAGNQRRDEQRNLDALAAHLQSLGRRYLPDGQSLKIEVLQVDLAGEVHPTRRGFDLRITRGGADWPRISLRYTLQGEGGAVLRQGEETVSDMAYQMHAALDDTSEPLRYEKRMLDDWFRARFASSPSR